jgi:hypothetical protein
MFLVVLLALCHPSPETKPTIREQLPGWLRFEVERFEADYGVELVIDGKDFVRELSLHFTIQANGVLLETLLRELPTLLQELRLYPKSFLRRVRLKRIHLCRNLNIYGYRDYYLAGNVSLNGDEIYFDLDCYRSKKTIPSNCTYRISTYHHELFHCIDTRLWTRNPSDSSWMMLNPPGFQYYASRLMDYSRVSNQYPGFVSVYARSSCMEDKAETYSFIMTNLHEMEQRALDDPILQKKIDLLKTRLRTFAPEIDEHFWHRIRHMPRPRLTAPGEEDAWALAHPHLPSLVNECACHHSRLPRLKLPRLPGRRCR